MLIFRKQFFFGIFLGIFISVIIGIILVAILFFVFKKEESSSSQINKGENQGIPEEAEKAEEELSGYDESLNFILRKINAISPVEAHPEHRWLVSSISFIDKKTAYVDYDDTLTHKRLLVKLAKIDNKIEYSIEGNFDRIENSWKIIEGNDFYKDIPAENLLIYVFDEKTKKWLPQKTIEERDKPQEEPTENNEEEIIINN